MCKRKLAVGFVLLVMLFSTFTVFAEGDLGNKLDTTPKIILGGESNKNTQTVSPNNPVVTKPNTDPKASDLMNNFKVVDTKSLSEGVKKAQPVARIAGVVVSIAIYYIFIAKIVMVIPNLIYIAFPFTRRMLGGVDGAAAEGAVESQVTSARGGSTPAQAKASKWAMLKNGGIVTDDAKRVVQDSLIEHKFLHYMVSEISTFVILGMCALLLTTSVWFGYGFKIGELVLKGLNSVITMFS